MGNVVSQLDQGMLKSQLCTFATSSGKSRTVQMAMLMPNITMIFGNQAWFLSSGCW